MRVFIASLPVTTTAVQTDVVPGPADPLQSWMDSHKPLSALLESPSTVSDLRNPSLESARGVSASFRVVMADRYGNKCRTGGVQLQANFTGPTYFEGAVHDPSDGSYSVSYASEIAGLSDRLLESFPRSCGDVGTVCS